MSDDELTAIIIGCAYNVHNTLGSGFLEKVYENALRVELIRRGLSVRQQEPIKVHCLGNWSEIIAQTY
jgi:GxxExxY protein